MISCKKHNEQEIIETINKVLASLAPKYSFGIFSVEDIKQEGFIIAIEKLLPLYDGSAPLENFLRISLNDRLKNFKRDNTYRINRPCSKCKRFSENCSNCLKRAQNQEVKKNLLNPIDISITIDNKNTSYEGSLIDTLEMVEIIDRINKRLPVEYRQDYLKIKEGVYVPKSRKEEIEALVTKIVEEEDE